MSAEFDYSQFFTVTYVVVYPIASFSVMFLAYGFYTLLFLLCVNALTKSRYNSTQGTPHSLYLWSIVLLFVTGTVNVIVFAHDKVRGMSFMFTALQTGDDTGFWKFMTVDRLSIAEEGIYNLLAVICNVSLPPLNNFLVLGLISNILTKIIGPSEHRRRLVVTTGDLAQFYKGAYAGNNLLITALTASRIWWTSREARKFFGSGVHGLYLRVVTIILESGILYPVSSFVAIGLDESASEIGVPIEIGPTVSLIAGIAPALIIVRCQVFNALQNHTAREVGALSTLGFNSNTGGVTNPAQNGSQVRDVEAQSGSFSRPADDAMGDSNTHDEEKGINERLSSSPRAL
ncbi:hypothetical protein PQX77_006103 [Marasmius sp. AFHP31]|nr:hypothetical protein PQX77_006103 [Marasmius sp. AFHP31]